MSPDKLSIKEAIKSISYNYLGYFANAIIAFISTPIIVHSLGNAQYGIWSLIMSITGYYGLINLGLGSALTKYVAEYHTKGDYEETNRIVNSSFPHFIFISIGVLITSFVLSIYFNKLFIIGDVELRLVKIIVVLVGTNIAIGFLFRPFRAVLTGLRRFQLENIIGISSSMIRSICLIIVLKLGYGLMAMAAVIITIDVLTHLIIAIATKKVFANLSIRLQFINKESLRQLYHFGFFNFMRYISRLIVERSDTIIIGIFLGPIPIAIYSIALSLLQYSWQIVKAIYRVIMPFSSGLKSLDNIVKLRMITTFFAKYMFAITMFMAIEFFFVGEYFINLWLGKGYYQSYVIFCVLMIPRFGMMSHETMIATMVGMGYNKFLGYLSLAEAIINVGLSIYLVKIWGVIGIALGTVIPLTITRTFVVPVYSCKLLDLKLKDFIKDAYLPSLFCALPCILFTYGITVLINPTSFLRLFIDVTLAGLLFVVFFYYFIEPEVKKIVQKRIRFKFVKGAFEKIWHLSKNAKSS